MRKNPEGPSRMKEIRDEAKEVLAQAEAAGDDFAVRIARMVLEVASKHVRERDN